LWGNPKYHAAWETIPEDKKVYYLCIYVSSALAFFPSRYPDYPLPQASKVALPTGEIPGCHLNIVTKYMLTMYFPLFIFDIVCIARAVSVELRYLTALERMVSAGAVLTKGSRPLLLA